MKGRPLTEHEKVRLYLQRRPIGIDGGDWETVYKKEEPNERNERYDQILNMVKLKLPGII